MSAPELRRRIAELTARIGVNRHRVGILRKARAALQRRLRGLRRPTTMYDSVTPEEIPPGARAVAGYVGGRWPTFKALVVGWPKAWRLSIAVNASERAHCLDVENGDATPEQAPPWAKEALGRGVKRPVIYCSASVVDQVVGLLEAAGVHRSQVRVWSAHYGRGRHLCGPSTCGEVHSTDVDATQYDDRALGRNLDVSVLRRSFFT